MNKKKVFNIIFMFILFVLQTYSISTQKIDKYFIELPQKFYENILKTQLGSEEKLELWHPKLLLSPINFEEKILINSDLTNKNSFLKQKVYQKMNSFLEITANDNLEEKTNQNNKNKFQSSKMTCSCKFIPEKSDKTNNINPLKEVKKENTDEIVLIQKEEKLNSPSKKIDLELKKNENNDQNEKSNENDYLKSMIKDLYEKVNKIVSKNEESPEPTKQILSNQNSVYVMKQQEPNQVLVDLKANVLPYQTQNQGYFIQNNPILNDNVKYVAINQNQYNPIPQTRVVYTQTPQIIYSQLNQQQQQPQIIYLMGQ